MPRVSVCSTTSHTSFACVHFSEMRRSEFFFELYGKHRRKELQRRAYQDAFYHSIKYVATPHLLTACVRCSLDRDHRGNKEVFNNRECRH